MSGGRAGRENWILAGGMFTKGGLGVAGTETGKGPSTEPSNRDANGGQVYLVGPDRSERREVRGER